MNGKFSDGSALLASNQRAATNISLQETDRKSPCPWVDYPPWCTGNSQSGHSVCA